MNKEDDELLNVLASQYLIQDTFNHANSPQGDSIMRAYIEGFKAATTFNARTERALYLAINELKSIHTDLKDGNDPNPEDILIFCNKIMELYEEDEND